MAQAKRKYSTFEHGAAWLRADFHLHTNADKEFVYEGKEEYYHAAYMSLLEEQGIKVGAITNYN